MKGQGGDEFLDNADNTYKVVATQFQTMQTLRLADKTSAPAGPPLTQLIQQYYTQLYKIVDDEDIVCQLLVAYGLLLQKKDARCITEFFGLGELHTPEVNYAQPGNPKILSGEQEILTAVVQQMLPNANASKVVELISQIGLLQEYQDE